MPVPQPLVEAGVSQREAEVLAAVGEHLTNAEIGSKLYISVRTVESHVSSLLRKLGLGDRRELARFAAGLPGPGTGPAGGRVAVATADAVEAGSPELAGTSTLPVPLTSFVGRTRERADLAAAVREQRLVTALGPGGVGKTRLAVAVAGDLAADHAGGVWYTDLVPVTDPAMIAPTVAAVLGLEGTAGLTAVDTVVAALARREALLVLDNCEHLVDGVAVFVEKLLASCEGVRVLATSRTRLLVPFEQVYPVPGLSLSGGAGSSDGAGDGSGAADPGPAEPGAAAAGDEASGDAVSLFQARAAAVGAPVADGDLPRVAGVCRALDGVALAIELAAARLPTLGLDGLEAGLGDRLRLLSGGSRADGRHSSLRAALDWSYELAEPVDRAVLRRVAVFAAPFTVDAAAVVAGFDPVPAGEALDVVADAVGRLADQSLVVARPGSGGIRYRLLETVRQYGDTRLRDAGEEAEARRRHLRWCQGAISELDPGAGEHGSWWRPAFDAVAADLRAAFGWVAEQEDLRDEAHALAVALGEVTFHRGLAGEAQRRFEQAAALTGGVARADALHQAAGAAASRDAGDDALRLHQEAAASATAAGASARAARDMALAATLVHRAPGIMTTLPSPADPERLLAEAAELAAGDAVAETAVLVGRAFAAGRPGDAAEIAREAVDAAARAGDPLLLSAALDELTVEQLSSGQMGEAAASAMRRIELLGPVPHRADSSFELHDAHHMAVETHIGVGELGAARELAEPLLGLPGFREGQLGAIRLVVADALAGDWGPVMARADRFRRDWVRQGRPPIAVLARGINAVAMVLGLQGDDGARASWEEMYRIVRSHMAEESCGRTTVSAMVFDGLVHLHRLETGRALVLMAVDPGDLHTWYDGMWRQWYASVWAEAAVLAGEADAAARVERARLLVSGNPVASALVERADAWSRGDREELLATAGDLEAAGCRYQVARTLVLAGGDEEAEGARRLAAMGAAPMAVPG